MIWILLVNFIVYFKTLKLGFVSDDLPTSIQSKEEQKRKKGLWYSILGVTKNSELEHFKTLLIHTAVCAAIYLALGQNTIALVAALLFSVNPMNNQCSVWISGRGYALCALFLMLSMALPYLSPIFLLLATVSPAGFFAPLGFIGSNHYYLVALLPLVWLFFHKRLFGEVKKRRDREAVSYDKKFSIDKIIIAIKTYGYYFALYLVPFKLTWYDSFMQSGAGGGNEDERKKALKKDWTFFLGLALIGFMIYSLFNWTPVAWGLLWYSVCISPYLNLVHMQQEIATRYLYIPGIGLMFALAHFLNPLLTAFILGAYITRLIAHYNVAYVNDYWIVEASVLEDKNAWFAWNIRAHKRWDTQSYREALNMWVMASLTSPKEFKILFNIAVVLKILGKHDESKVYIERAKNVIVSGQEKIASEVIAKYEEGKELPLLK